MIIHSESLKSNTDWYEYRNELPLNTLKAWREEILATARFEHTGWTGAPKEPYRHWCYTPNYEGVFVRIFECLNESFKEEGLKLKPERLLLNVYNHGDSSWLHIDTDKPGYWTAILFMNEYWDVNWGGDFVLVKDSEIYKSFAPTPGKFVLFQSNILHGARPVSREAQFPRAALAIQCSNDSKI
jgi:hypothetical protein